MKSLFSGASNLFSGLTFKDNIVIALLKWLLLSLLFYTLCRLGFYLFNLSYFPGLSWRQLLFIFYGGVRFDVAAILYMHIPLILMVVLLPFSFQYKPAFKKALHYVFVVVNAIGLAANVIDFIYFRFTLRRTTITIFDQFKHEQNIPHLFWQFFVDYWYAVLVWILLVWAIARLSKKITYSKPVFRYKAVYYTGRILLIPVIAGLFVAGVRGGFRYSTRPITLSNAAEYVTDQKEVNIVLNTPFAFIRTMSRSTIKQVDYFSSESALNAIYTPIHHPADTAAFSPNNVVVIILESFSKEFIGAYNKDNNIPGYVSYTPFLDSLIGQSRAYQYSFANGRKSIDGMPSVISSIPSIEIPFVLSHFSTNKINALPRLLSNEGYYTAFFHGAPNGSMGFDAFANQAGFKDYYGKTEYNNDADFDNIWGIWDEPFLQFFANKMNGFKQPFYTALFSVSSHHPFNLPDAYKGVFKGGPIPIHKNIQYTDFALRRFFATASTMPWFKNTLFVITADHAAGDFYEQYYNSAAGFFSVPLFFYKPGDAVVPMDKKQPIQQIDIMPTVLGYLHYKKDYFAYGRNILDSTSTPFAFNFLNNNYQLFLGDYLLLSDGQKVNGLYNYKTDFGNQKDLQQALPDTVTHMNTYLKAFIQQYNNRMIDNSLTTEGSQIQLQRKQ